MIAAFAWEETTTDRVSMEGGMIGKQICACCKLLPLLVYVLDRGLGLLKTAGMGCIEGLPGLPHFLYCCSYCFDLLS